MKSNPKHVATWTAIRRALDRIRQDTEATGKRVSRG